MIKIYCRTFSEQRKKTVRIQAISRWGQRNLAKIITTKEKSIFKEQNASHARYSGTSLRTQPCGRPRQSKNPTVVTDASQHRRPKESVPSSDAVVKRKDTHIFNQ